jgi:hypothetical protein
MNEPINNAIDFLKIIRTQPEVIIRFIKKDKTIRMMKCTLQFDLIPKIKQPKKVDLAAILNLVKQNILRVFDLEKKEWRSIPYDRVEYLETPTKERFYIKK